MGWIREVEKAVSLTLSKRAPEVTAIHNLSIKTRRALFRVEPETLL